MSSAKHSWIEHYGPQIPRTLAPYPDKTLVDFVRAHASAHPTADAIYFKGSRLSYRKLDRLSDAFAVWLTKSGVRRGDTVALILPNCPQFLIAEIGAWKAGATVLPMNPLYTASELIEPLRSCGAKVVVVLTPFYARVKEIQQEAGIGAVLATNIKEYLPAALRTLFTLFKEKRDGHRITLDSGDVWFQACLKDEGAPPVSMARADDGAVMLLSGGTTGLPKAVVGRHRDLIAAGLQIKVWLGAGPEPDTGGDILLVPLPLFHVYACVGAQSHALISRLPLALVPNPRDINDLLDTIQRVKPTLFSGVPALFIAMLNHSRVQARKVNFTSIRASFSGSAPLMAATKEQFERLSGGRIVEGYSLTEALMACVVNPLEGINKLGSVGIPLPDVEIAIVDSVTGERLLPAREVGEVMLRAPQIMSGYWNNPEETARALRMHGEGGAWLHTGDLGYLDEDAYLFIVDRQKDLIKTSGYQVWPREVEETLAAHPAVMEVGVAGVPDRQKGEAVKAWVVRRQGFEVSEQELRSFCRSSLAPYKVPSHIEFRESLPKTMAGKVLRRELVQKEKAQAG